METPTTITEFIAWCNDHLKQEEDSFWGCVEKDFPNDSDLDAVELWREAIQANTTTRGTWYNIGYIVRTYVNACNMFGKDEFDADVTQFYNDNKDTL